MTHGSSTRARYVPTLQRPTAAVFAALLPTLATPRADPVAAKAEHDAFGLLIGVRFDVAAMGGNDDQSSVLAVVIEAFHKLAAGLGITFRQRRIGRRKRDGALERVIRAKAPTARQTDADHIGVIFVPKLADGVQGVLRRRAADPDLLPERRPHGSEEPTVDGAVFSTGFQVVLRRQRLPDDAVRFDHGAWRHPDCAQDDRVPVRVVGADARPRRRNDAR